MARHGGEVTGDLGAIKLVLDGFKWADVCVQHWCRQPYRQSFQRASNGKQVIDFAPGHVAHTDTAIWLGKQQAVRGQLTKSFAHRRAAHRQFFGKVVFGQPLSGGQTAFADGIGNGVRDVLNRQVVGFFCGRLHHISPVCGGSLFARF